MNKRFYYFVIFVVVSQLLFCSVVFAKSDKSQKSAKPAKVEANQPVAPAKNQPQASAPSNARIKFDTLVHDFNKVGPDTNNDCKFKFTNVGKDVLKIDRLQGSCKCTVPDLQKKEYAPGESGEITVQFHSPKFQGATSQHVMVFSNDSNEPRVELEIKAFVQLAVQVTPELLNLSFIAPNGGASPITVTSLDGEKFAVTKFESFGNVISISVDPNKISDKFIFNPVVDVNNLRKNLNSSALFTITHSKCKEIKIQYSCLREYEASPTVIIIRNAVVGEIQKRTVYLTSNYNQPIEIESVSSDKGIIKVINKEKTENSFKFDIEIAPPLAEGKSRVFSDNLRIKIKGKEQIDVACRGFYKAAQ
ncbi:MAG: DUF1573 domain-containing protein [Sedimentisphaerales bacterium]